MKYKLGDPVLTFPEVSALKSDCLNSYFALLPDPLPPGIKATNDTSSRMISLSVEAQSQQELKFGYTTISVEEKDIYTGFTAKTDFIISVEASEARNKTKREYPKPFIENSTDALEEQEQLIDSGSNDR